MLVKRALRIALGILAVYLAVSFIYTAVDMAPWKPHHAHDMFGGWGGVFLFFSVYPEFDLYLLFARGDSQPALVRRLLYAVPLLTLSYLVFRRSRSASTPTGNT